MPNKSFFSGMEEILSRLVSLLVCVAFFAIFVIAKPDQAVTLNAKDLSIWLLLFWFIYECIGFILHSLFIYFGKSSNKKPFPIKEEITLNNSDDINT